MDTAQFFATVRSSVFGGRLSMHQVEGCEAILSEALRRGTALDHLAYILATACHETGATMQPVEERLSYTSARLVAVWPKRFPTIDAARPYAGNPRALANKVYGGRMGNVAAEDGWLFRGRGLAQITGRANYQKFGIAGDPDKALELPVAVRILFDGMESGAFTGKKLGAFLDGEDEADAEDLREFIAARSTVNGTDRAADIGKIALRFEAALRAAGYVVTPPAQVPPTPPYVPPVAPVAVPWWLALINAILALFKRKNAA